MVLAQTAPAAGAPEGQKPPFTSPAVKANVILPNAVITVDYGAPSTHGRTIFGGADQKPLVPYGEVWRTGANAATTLKTNSNLQIGDLAVPAGTYTLYSVPTEGGWTLIVNKQTGQWGTVYDKSKDLGRVTMETGATAVPVEMFVIDFEKTLGSATELHLKWASVDAFVQVTAVK
jgi:hypothetical protein